MTVIELDIGKISTSIIKKFDEKSMREQLIVVGKISLILVINLAQ